MALESVSPILFETVSAVTLTPSSQLGMERTVAGEKYVYVYNCGVSTAAVGQGLSRPVSAFAGIYSCSVSGISGAKCLGFVKHADIPTLGYGWALKKGILAVSITSFVSSLAAGNASIGAGNGTIVSGLTAGYELVGELLTAIVSGNTGTLHVDVK